MLYMYLGFPFMNVDRVQLPPFGCSFLQLVQATPGAAEPLSASASRRVLQRSWRRSTCSRERWQAGVRIYAGYKATCK